MAMTQDTYNRVKAIMDQYEVPPMVWYPIAMAESGGNPNAHGDVNLGGTGSWGLFQLYTGGGQGGNKSGAELTVIETNARIAAPYFQKAYEAIKGKYPDSLMAAEVGIRSGHPGGSVASPYRASVALYNSIKSYALAGVPSSFSGGAGRYTADTMQPADSTGTASDSGVVDNALGAVTNITGFLSQVSSFLSYIGINAGLMFTRIVLIAFAIPVILLGMYFLMKSMGD